jgi:hypothetical protein
MLPDPLQDIHEYILEHPSVDLMRRPGKYYCVLDSNCHGHVLAYPVVQHEQGASKSGHSMDSPAILVAIL